MEKHCAVWQHWYSIELWKAKGGFTKTHFFPVLLFFFAQINVAPDQFQSELRINPLLMVLDMKLYICFLAKIAASRNVELMRKSWFPVHRGVKTQICVFVRIFFLSFSPHQFVRFPRLLLMLQRFCEDRESPEHFFVLPSFKGPPLYWLILLQCVKQKGCHRETWTRHRRMQADYQWDIKHCKNKTI